jgi:hypothetical protein
VRDFSPASSRLDQPDPPIATSGHVVLRPATPSAKPLRSAPTSTASAAPATPHLAAKVALVNLLGYLRALHTAGTFVMRRELAL